MADLDLAAIKDNLPAHYFDCDRCEVYDHGTRQGKCDCLATEHMNYLIAEVERLQVLLGSPPQRKPVCEVCGDSVIYVPRSGFGNTGEWRHLAPPRTDVKPHAPAPKVFVDPPLIVNAGNESGPVRDE